MHLEFDPYLRLTGDWRFKYGQHIGLCICKLNINWQWSSVSEGFRKALWDETMAIFNLEDDPKIKKAKHEKAQRSAKMNEHNHHLGQHNYEDVRKIWIKEGFYPSNSEQSRCDDWFCSVHKKDKQTGKRSIPKPKTKSITEKYCVIREKQAKGEFTPHRNQDALCEALGKSDHLSRALGFGGVNVGIRMVFGKPTPKAKSDRETLKAELREELKEEFNASMKENLSLILQSMGISTPLPSTTPSSHPQPLPPKLPRWR